MNQTKSGIMTQQSLFVSADTLFLLQFLRTAKFSQLNARERLEAFMSAKTIMPQWFSDIDTLDEKIQAFYSTGLVNRTIRITGITL